GHNGEIGFDFGGASLDKGLTDKDAARASIRGGDHLTAPLQIEGQDVGPRAKDSPGGARTTPRGLALFPHAGVHFYPGRGNVVPYFLGGVGLATVKIEDSSGNADDTGGAWQIAAGTRFFFGAAKRAALRLEYAHMTHKTSGLVFGGLLLDQDHFKDDSFTLGFTWRL